MTLCHAFEIYILIEALTLIAKVTKRFENVTKWPKIWTVLIPSVAISNWWLINYDVINADLMARTIFNIKLRLSTELGVEGCGSDYNPVVQ